jgi:hypothetical protein
MERIAKVAVIYWLDASSPSPANGQWTLDEVRALEPIPMVDVGFVLVDCPTHVTLAGNATEDGSAYRRLITIPRKMIVKKVIL